MNRTADKRRYVRDMFARIAPRYDLMNQLMTFGQHQRWRVQAAHLALDNARNAPAALDLATGTGDFIAALHKVNPETRAVGLDLTAAMLGVAVEKSRAEDKQLTRLLVGDALDLPFTDNSFDAVTSGFMLRNVTDLSRSFAEMVRVVKPNGRIVALEITRPGLPVWRALYRFYFYRFVPLLGGLISGQLDAYRYLPQSLSDFVAADELVRIMMSAGVREVKFRLLMLGTVAIHWGLK